MAVLSTFPIAFAGIAIAVHQGGVFESCATAFAKRINVVKCEVRPRHRLFALRTLPIYRGIPHNAPLLRAEKPFAVPFSEEVLQESAQNQFSVSPLRKLVCCLKYGQ